MNLSDVHQSVHRHKKLKRVGRGTGSGHGKTSGRGHKGQGALAGWTSHPAFEGGQFPLSRRIPKRGFHNRWGKTVAVINVGQLDKAFENGDEVTIETLRAKNLAKSRFDVLKILGDGELGKQLKVSAHRFSETAMAKIRQAGGETIVLPGPAPVVKNTAKKKGKAKGAAQRKKPG